MNEINWKINLNDIICLWLCLQAQKPYNNKVLKCKGIYNNSKSSKTTMCSVVHTSDVFNNIIIFLSSKNMAFVCNSLCLIKCDALPSFLFDPKCVWVIQIAELWRTRGTLPALSIKRGRGSCWSSKMGLGRVTSFSYLLELASNQPTSWLVPFMEHL